MAIRPIYLPQNQRPFFRKNDVDFKWFPGLSTSQKQKSIDSLHQSAKECLHISKILDISSKSKVQEGNQLSAFHLNAYTKDNHYIHEDYSVEVVFQTSKVFNDTLHSVDLLGSDVLSVRKSIREREQQGLTGFMLEGIEWGLNPIGAFYNFLYIRSLLRQIALSEKITEYDGFTDIAFNPKKSLNCQAEATAMLVGIINHYNHDLSYVYELFDSQKLFLNVVYGVNETTTDRDMDLDLNDL